MLGDASLDLELGIVAASLGSLPAEVEPVEWGDGRATFRLALADGRGYAVRRLPGRDAPLAHRIASTAALISGAGLPVTRPKVTPTSEATWLSVPWVDGTTGAAWLHESGRARRLAERMGELVRLVGRIDPAGIPPRTGATGDAHAAVAGHVASLALEPAVRHAVASAIGRDDSAGGIRPRVVHGDFAPINVIVDTEGEITALLDFEHSHAGDPLLDVAWWGWVVRHHHPEAWAAAWPTFRAAAGVDVGVTDTDLHALALLELARRAASAEDEEARRRWDDRLEDAATWTVARGDQPT